MILSDRKHEVLASDFTSRDSFRACKVARSTQKPANCRLGHTKKTVETFSVGTGERSNTICSAGEPYLDYRAVGNTATLSSTGISHRSEVDFNCPAS